MNKIELLINFLESLDVPSDKTILLEGILDAARSMSTLDSYWSFARDVNPLPKKGYFQLATVDTEGIPDAARKRFGTLPNPTFTSGTFSNGK